MSIHIAWQIIALIVIAFLGVAAFVTILSIGEESITADLLATIVIFDLLAIATLLLMLGFSR